jgi:hypothetical protein
MTLAVMCNAFHLPPYVEQHSGFKNGFVITYEYHYAHPVTNDVHGLNPLPFSRLPNLKKQEAEIAQ